jgi:hypothetical protein
MFQPERELQPRYRSCRIAMARACACYEINRLQSDTVRLRVTRARVEMDVSDYQQGAVRRCDDTLAMDAANLLLLLCEVLKYDEVKLYLPRYPGVNPKCQ